MRKYRDILLNIPNIIGYFRLLLTLLAWIEWEKPSIFLPLFTAACFLDFLDGIAARKLEQTSAFGAWLDVALDNISRGMVWSRLYLSWGFVIPALEWLTFVCTHQLGKNWKQPKEAPPRIVSLVMANNFNTVLGLWAILSVWLLPLWLYCIEFAIVSIEAKTVIVTTVLIAGRLLAFYVESWFILQHIKGLLNEDCS